MSRNTTTNTVIKFTKFVGISVSVRWSRNVILPF